jgi:anti-anti-sigma factor
MEHRGITPPELVNLSLVGDYDLVRREELDELLSAARTSRIAVLDMQEVSYIDSTALTCFIRLKKRMAKHGPAIICILHPQQRVRRVIELARLDELFDLID